MSVDLLVEMTLRLPYAGSVKTSLIRTKNVHAKTCLTFLIGAACLFILIVLLNHRLGGQDLLHELHRLSDLGFTWSTNDGISFNCELHSEDNSSATINLSEEVDGILTSQRLLIDFETQRLFHNSTRELNAGTVRVLVVASWRSGSTFLGSVINSYPGNFYHVEPLVDYKNIQIREEPLASEALNRLTNLFNCNYSDAGRYIKMGQGGRRWYFSQNTRLWNAGLYHPHFCWSLDILSRFCRLFPFQSMKVVRLRLKFVETLLADPSQNLKVVLLVRDPRGTMRSRAKCDFCRRSPDCADPGRLCRDLVDDYIAAVHLREEYPNSFRVIRYEDFSLDPYTGAKDLFNFLGLEFHPDTQLFLDTHTKFSDNHQFSTYRNSSVAPFLWRHDFAYEEVENIQRSCEPAMKLWGYRLAGNKTHQLELDPVGSYSLQSKH